MYTREYPPTEPTHEIPTGYAGNAFPPRDAPPAESVAEAGARPYSPPKHHRHDPGAWLSRLSLSRLGDINLRSFLSGDLLLIVVALLLVTSNDDDCEESGDLWILLLLLYFMK